MPDTHYRPTFKAVREVLHSLRSKTNTTSVVGTWSSSASCFVAVGGGSTCLPYGYAAALGDCDSDARLQFNPKAASFQVLDDIASLRQGIASIAMNAGSVGNALQAVAGLTQQLSNNSTLASLSALKTYCPSLRTQQAVVLASTWALASEPHFTSKLTAASASLLSSWQSSALSSASLAAVQRASGALSNYTDAAGRLQVLLSEQTARFLTQTDVDALSRILVDVNNSLTSLVDAHTLILTNASSTPRQNGSLVLESTELLATAYVAHHWTALTASLAIRDQYLWGLYSSYVTSGVAIPSNFTATANTMLATLVDQRVQPLLDRMAALFTGIAGLANVSPCLRTKLAELGRISFSFSSPVASSSSYLLSLGLYDCRALQSVHDTAAQDGKPQAELLWLVEGDAVAKSGDLTRVATTPLGNSTPINTYYLYLPRNAQSTLTAVPSSQFASNNTALNLAGESLSPVLRRGDTVHEGDDESGETDLERQPSESIQGQRRVVERGQCNPGYYGVNCTICSNGSSNGPLGRVSYPEYGVQTAQCPFVCLNPSLYANEAYNACIPTPIGFYSPNGGHTLLPCRRTGISPQFYQWTSGGTRNSPTSCNGTVVYQALAIAPPSDLYSMAALNGTQFTLQMWIDWEDTYKSGDANSSAAGVGFGLLGVTQVWRWYLQRMADGHSRLVFETINSTNMAALSDAFVLDAGWHHMAVTGDNARRVVTFYVDGNQIGNDWYDRRLFRSTDPASTELALGGQRSTESSAFGVLPTTFALLTAQLDEISITHARLPVDRLGWHSPSSRYEAFCVGLSSDLVKGWCLPRCPNGMTRNETALALGSYRGLAAAAGNRSAAPTAASWQSFMGGLEDGCRCPPGTERWFDACLTPCMPGALRDQNGRCQCPAGSYQAWGANATRYVTFDFSLPSSAIQVQIAEIELFDANDTKLAVLGCVEGEPTTAGSGGVTSSSCPRLYDGRKEPASALFASYAPPAGLEPYAWAARGTGRARVTLDLGVRPPAATRALSRIVIYMTARMRDALANATTHSSSTVDTFLSTEAVPAGSLDNTSDGCALSVRVGDKIVSGASLLVESFFGLLPSAALVLDDTQMTPTQSLGSLSCAACPAHSTISNAPRTSVKLPNGTALSFAVPSVATREFNADVYGTTRVSTLMFHPTLSPAYPMYENYTLLPPSLLPAPSAGSALANPVRVALYYPRNVTDALTLRYTLDGSAVTNASLIFTNDTQLAWLLPSEETQARYQFLAVESTGESSSDDSAGICGDMVVVCIAVPIGGFLLGVVPTIMAAVAIHACYRRRKQERASPFSFLDELPPLFSAHQRHQRTTEQNERDRSESIHLTEPPPSAAAPSPLHVSSVRFSTRPVSRTADRPSSGRARAAAMPADSVLWGNGHLSLPRRSHNPFSSSSTIGAAPPPPSIINSSGPGSNGSNSAVFLNPMYSEEDF
ncbi:uncharacterized protein ACA1_370270 [Acanthamoeba castellanii str. Neff]|uniref:Uncharacterized protein n=1 Tax=Acanthamoeba castellanii (strain ATCC 30010 / Neff) TaxID=1257118 RepID=L8H0H8_ACACF|nr:uncharacterized protein ACA1_370270 [Acanthamoeba castellanii str. Neff]ELR18273.1 hypothetical protein ACA1_370270 [Acanthamoeba castellanii str. Neff]